MSDRDLLLDASRWLRFQIQCAPSGDEPVCSNRVGAGLWCPLFLGHPLGCDQAWEDYAFKAQVPPVDAMIELDYRITQHLLDGSFECGCKHPRFSSSVCQVVGAVRRLMGER